MVRLEAIKLSDEELWHLVRLGRGEPEAKEQNTNRPGKKGRSSREEIEILHPLGDRHPVSDVHIQCVLNLRVVMGPIA